MAGFFPEKWLDEVRMKNDIADVIASYVPLQKKGKRHWACCPFHQEKTPSFSVDSQKQLYHCFGCKASGNVISFVMAMDRLDFVDAVKQLATRAHMPIPEISLRDEEEMRYIRSLKERLYEAGKMAAQYFYDQLFSERGQLALDYLMDRGLSEPIIRRFGLGYAPDTWDALLHYAKEQGFTEEELEKAGLIQKGKASYYDQFRHRIMFPIVNPYGHVIGFGGRVLDGSQPKYLNTKETLIFDKRNNLYGLNLLKKKRDIEYVLFVEGYMDVVSLHQHGIDAVVASLGTALTVEQASIIKRYNNHIYLAYDGDDAGQTAALRGMEILFSAGCDVRIVQFPDKLDPDEFIRKKGRGAFHEALENALSLPEFKMLVLAQKHDLSSEEGRLEYAKACAPIIGALQHPVEREMYLKKLQVRSGFSMEALREQMGLAPSTETTKKSTPQRMNATRLHTAAKAERGLLQAMLQDTALAELLAEKVSSDEFSLPLHQQLYETFKTMVLQGQKVDVSTVINRYAEENPEEMGVVAEIFASDLDAPDVFRFAEDCLREMRRLKAEEHIKKLQEQLNSMSNNPNTEEKKALAMELQQWLLMSQKLKTKDLFDGRRG